MLIASNVCTIVQLISFCEAVQKRSPVGAYIRPIPGMSPGYGDEVIFADGTFVDGSTLELSADGPLREPFVAFTQVMHWSCHRGYIIFYHFTQTLIRLNSGIDWKFTLILLNLQFAVDLIKYYSKTAHLPKCGHTCFLCSNYETTKFYQL